MTRRANSHKGVHAMGSEYSQLPVPGLEHELLMRLDLHSGDVVWAVEVRQRSAWTPARWVTSACRDVVVTDDVVIGRDGRSDVAAFDANDGTLRWVVSLPVQPTSIALSPDGRRLLVARNQLEQAVPGYHRRGVLLVYSVPDGQLLLEVPLSDEPAYPAGKPLAISADHRRIAINYRDGGRILDAETGREMARYPTVFIAVAPDLSNVARQHGRELVVERVGDDGAPVVEMTHPLPDAHAARAAQMSAFSDDGRFLQLGVPSRSTGETVELIDVAAGRPVWPATGVGQVRSCAWLADETAGEGRLPRIVTNTGDVFDACTARTVGRIEELTGNAVCVSDDRRLAAALTGTGRGSRSVTVLDLRDMSIAALRHVGERDGCHPTFSPDGTRLAAGERIVHLASDEADDRIESMSGHPYPQRLVVFSPDGRLLASADRSCFRVMDIAR
ncbi:MAG: WD40 repeat domain-containing protein, partial [Planctomycetota bacterium]